MRKNLSYLLFLERTVIGFLVLYSVVCTVLVLKIQPKTTLIGIDEFGTRVITTSDDRLLKLEKENFLKRFLYLLYEYDQDTFASNIEQAGDLMTTALWETKKAEFVSVLSKLKEEPLRQTLKIKDIRSIDSNLFEADLELTVRVRLKTHRIPIRVSLDLKTQIRNEKNPYPFEISKFEEMLVQEALKEEVVDAKRSEK